MKSTEPTTATDDAQNVMTKKQRKRARQQAEKEQEQKQQEQKLQEQKHQAKGPSRKPNASSCRSSLKALSKHALS